MEMTRREWEEGEKEIRDKVRALSAKFAAWGRGLEEVRGGEDWQEHPCLEKHLMTNADVWFIKEKQLQLRGWLRV